MPARILVIEDNPTNLDLMTYLLSAFGHTPIVARDGEEGLRAALSERPDLIICDVQLPRLSGHEMARWLKSHPALRATPLVAVTALAMVGDRAQALEAGFDDYIAKPIDPQTFLAQIELLLRRERAPAAAAAERQGWSAPPSPRRETLLVVDNQPVNIDLARSTFEPFGYVVVAATGIGEALRLARQVDPDLILSDVNMGDGTGYDLIAAVKGDPQLLCGAQESDARARHGRGQVSHPPYRAAGPAGHRRGLPPEARKGGSGGVTPLTLRV